MSVENQCRSAERIGKVVQSEVSRQTWDCRLVAAAMARRLQKRCWRAVCVLPAAGFQTLVSQSAAPKGIGGSFYGISMCGRGQRKVPVYLNGSRAVLYLPDVPGRRVCLRRKLARQLSLYDLAAAGWVRTGSAPRLQSINPCGAGIRPASVSGDAVRTARPCTALPHHRHLHHRRKPRLADSALCPAQHLCGRHCIPYYPCCCVNGGCCTSRLYINVRLCIN